MNHAPDIAADPMGDADRSACAVCADFLATGRAWSALALLSGLATVCAVAMPAGRLGSLHALPCVAALLALTVLERFLASRVALDSRLFGRLARGELHGLADLDRALTRLWAIDPAKLGRPLAPRVAGARRLYRHQVIATLALAALAVAAWCPAGP